MILWVAIGAPMCLFVELLLPILIGVALFVLLVMLWSVVVPLWLLLLFVWWICELRLLCFVLFLLLLLLHLFGCSPCHLFLYGFVYLLFLGFALSVELMLMGCVVCNE